MEWFDKLPVTYAKKPERNIKCDFMTLKVYEGHRQISVGVVWGLARFQQLRALFYNYNLNTISNIPL